MSAELSAEEFETYRPQLRSIAYRVLGSTADAEDAVQEAWLRAHAAGTDGVENLGGWLTTIVARMALNLLRSRRSRREVMADGQLPDFIVTAPDARSDDPAGEALRTDDVAVALLVVMDRLSPAERVSFVLHDQFSVPFEEIAPIVDRSVAATRQLASRARRKVRDTVPEQDDVARRREVVAAYRAASQAGDFDALLALLDPDVVLRLDLGQGELSRVLRGATAVATQASLHFETARYSRLALVNSEPGLVTVLDDGRAHAALAFTVRDGRVTGIDVLAAPDRIVLQGPLPG